MLAHTHAKFYMHTDELIHVYSIILHCIYSYWHWCIVHTAHIWWNLFKKKKWKLHEYPLTCVVWYRICIDGIVVVSFKCIDLEPMLLVSSSAKSACLYRVIWKNNNKRIRIKIDQASLIHLNEWTAYNRCVFNTHFHRHASTRRAIS